MAVGDVDDGIGDRYDGCWGGGVPTEIIMG